MKTGKGAKTSPPGCPPAPKDVEPRQVLERTVKWVEDPDFELEAIHHESFVLQLFGPGPAKPPAAADLIALGAIQVQYELPNRLENARRGLSMIADIREEYAAGSALLKKAERMCQQVNNETLTYNSRVRSGDSAHALLNHLGDVILAGLRRKDLRHARAIVRAGRSDGGKARAENLRDEFAGRDKEILRTHARLLSEGKERHELAGILAAKHRLDRSTIRRILKKAGVS